MKKKISLFLAVIMVFGLFPMLLVQDTYATGEKLEASGGTFLYDGLPHYVTAKVVDGVGFTIEYSVDGGKTWSTTVPCLTDPGKLTVNVRAIKDSTLLTHDPVILEVTQNAPSGSTVTIVAHGSTTTAPIRRDPSSSSPKVGTINAGETCTLIENGEKWYKIQYGSIEGYVYYWFVQITSLPPSGGDDTPSDPSSAVLTVTGGVFLYDGNAHKVVAELTNGEGFTIEYSTNGGSTWTTTVPSLTEVGKLTVKVRATCSNYVLTHEDVILQVVGSLPVGTTLTIIAHGSTTVAPIREAASSSSAKLGTIEAGKTCTYLDKSGNWFKIKYGSIEGYVYYWFIKYGEINFKPVITEQPVACKVVQGKNATFVVAANDADNYQWQYKKPGGTSWINVKINGTYPTYILKTEMRHDGYTYRCKVSNEYGAVYSSTALLTVTLVEEPQITAQPQSVTVYVGKTAKFSVVATGATSIQWEYQKPGESIWRNVLINGTSANYSLVTEVRHDGYTYRCKLTNAGGTVYSDTAKLTVSEKPVISSQPKSVTVSEGDLATFKVVAAGATSIQWQYKKPGDTSWRKVRINGTSATYSLTTEARHNGNTYRCKLTNDKGTVYSKVVKLTVK